MSDYKCDVSVCATAVKTKHWKQMYSLYMKNKASIELVYVGNKYPSYNLPPNFKFIYSEVKPGQCMEIAIRNCSGEHVLIQADDCIPEDNYCDKMLSSYKKAVNESDGQIVFTGGVHYFGNQTKQNTTGAWPKSAIPIKKPFPMDCFVATKWYKEIGGYDPAFIGMYTHYDLVLRFLQAGGKFVRSSLIFREIDDIYSGFRDLSWRIKGHDQLKLRYLWWKYWYKKRWVEKYKGKGVLSKYKNKKELIDANVSYHIRNSRGFIPVKRNEKFVPYVDKDILTISQGDVVDPWVST